MKTLHTSLLALAAATLLAPAAQAAPIVSFYGYQVNTPEWRSTNVTKTITLPDNVTTTPAPSNAYGLDGWLLPNLVNDTYLPSYAPLSGITAPGTLGFTSGSYAQDVDDPTQPIGPNVANLPAAFWSIAYQSIGAGNEANLYNFTLSGTIPTSFLLGVAFGNLAHPAEDAFGTASFRAGINGGAGTGQVTAIANNMQIDWIFFRVDNAVVGNTVNIYATGGTNGLANLAAISFDTIPEPTTAGMLLLGGLGLAVLRRKRTA